MSDEQPASQGQSVSEILADIKQRMGLLFASMDTEFETTVAHELGKYWHEDVPFLLKYIDSQD